ncbi:MAG: NDP-sugar synthase [Clostridia bacterium]|nr:NDP-sugar synthase [Clostridia bacterium]
MTIVLSSVKTPLEYGVVLADAFERIFAFSEKPDWSETFSDLVNTGVYILSPKVLDRIPSEGVFDFSHDLFPLLLKEGYSLFGYKAEGYWCDIGRIHTLYRCNLDVMEGKAKIFLPESGRMVLSSDGKGKSFVSHSATVEEGAQLQSGSVIGEGAHLAAGSRVRGALIMEKVHVAEGALVQDAVLCEECRVSREGAVLPGGVLGAKSAVQRGAVTRPNQKYPPFSVVDRRLPFEEEGLVFTERGAATATEAGLDGRDSERLGYAFARAYGCDIAVLWEEDRESSAYFATLFAGGVIKGGQNALLLGRGDWELASFGMQTRALPGVFVSAENERGLFFALREDGFPPSRRDTLRLARFFAEEEDGAAPLRGKIRYDDGISELYRYALSEAMGDGALREIGFGGKGARLVREAAIKSRWRAYNETRGKGLSFEIFDRSLKCFLDGEKIADTEKARLYVIDRKMEEGKRAFVLPDTAPAFFTEHIESRGGKVSRFSFNNTVNQEEKERSLAVKERMLYDKSFLAAELMHYFQNKDSETIKAEFSATPDLYISRLRYCPEEATKARLLAAAGKGGIPREGSVQIRPGFYEIRIISESVSCEAALEGAFQYRGKLNEIEKAIRGR